jgi:hypothetical protein
MVQRGQWKREQIARWSETRRILYTQFVISAASALDGAWRVDITGVDPDGPFLEGRAFADFGRAADSLRLVESERLRQAVSDLTSRIADVAMAREDEMQLDAMNRASKVMEQVVKIMRQEVSPL